MLLHGVAHIRVSTSPVRVDGDLYAVFVRSAIGPILFDNWGAAHVDFMARVAAADRSNSGMVPE